MDLLLPFALKSLLVAGLTLAVLAFARGRSAAERSWIAHFGLVALLFLPLAGVVLPQLHLDMPAFMTVAPDKVAAPVTTPLTASPATSATSLAPLATEVAASSIDWIALLYGLPVIALLGVTLIALLRLFALRARAEVLVEPTWLSALAHAQRRMGFKHGTALLTSTDLHSPISWGLMRPVILLNEEALNAGSQAEAIIAHELAHVARLDWAKLMLARVAIALFWFNPLVWVLAREAHQLREETADDAVLAADIPDTDYAQLLVGVARHECKGLLLGAHGVAPSKGSLSRRVKRVLDGGLPRGPVAGSFAAGVAVGAVMFAAPLAAVTFAPKAPEAKAASAPAAEAVDEPQTLPGIVARAVAAATAQSSVMAANAVHSALGAQAVERDARQAERNARRLNPCCASQDEQRRILGIDDAYVRDLAAAGLGGLSFDELAEARTMGIDGAYVREMRGAGYSNLRVRDLAELRAVGVRASDVADLRRAGKGLVPVDKLIEYKALRARDGRWRDDREVAAEAMASARRAQRDVQRTVWTNGRGDMIVRSPNGSVEVRGGPNGTVDVRGPDGTIAVRGPGHVRIRNRDGRILVEPPEVPEAIETPEPPEPPETPPPPRNRATAG